MTGSRSTINSKRRRSYASIPIIVISAMKKAVEEIEQEGKIEVEGCLVKPFSINDLVAVIKEILPE